MLVLYVFIIKLSIFINFQQSKIAHIQSWIFPNMNSKVIRLSYIVIYPFSIIFIKFKCEDLYRDTRVRSKRTLKENLLKDGKCMG